MSGADSCLLCGSAHRRPVWRREAYPAIGGKAVPLGESLQVPWLPLEVSLCSTCGHIFQSHPPSPGALEGFYTGSYASSNPSPALGGPPPRGLREFLELIEGCVGPTPRGQALEIGSYDGYFLRLLADRGWTVTGYEPSPIGDVAARVFGLDIQRQFYRPGHGKRRWELVVSRYVFEHLESPVEMLQGLWAEMAPGAWLALEVPDMQTRLQAGILGCFAHEHLSYFVPATLRQAVEHAGFTVACLTSSAAGLALVAQRSADRPRGAMRGAPGCTAASSALLEEFLRQREVRRAAFAQALAGWRGPRRFVIYGGDSHTTDLLVEAWLPPSCVAQILDDDPVKQGQVCAGFDIPIGSLATLPPPGTALVVLSAFRHHDRLWKNLASWRSAGGAVLRFYPNCSLVPS